MNGRCRSGLLEQRIETTSKVVSILIGYEMGFSLSPFDLIAAILSFLFFFPVGTQNDNVFWVIFAARITS
jgi:hypothetical protein